MKSNFLTKDILINAAKDSILKLNPQMQIKNPVMFITEIGALLTTITMLINSFAGNFSGFELQISLWLWFTVVFANFSEAIAEGRGKAQAESLKKTRTATIARRLNKNNVEEKINSDNLQQGDLVICEAGDIIPSDGDVISGIAVVDESAITGESAPVIRESGGDRCAVTGGTRVISDKIIITITAQPGNSFLDRMISMVEGANRQKTPNEIALTILLTALTFLFLLAVITLKYFAGYSAKAAGQDLSGIITIPVLTSLLVCLIPTTIGGLLSAIGISGMDRLMKKNVIATSGRAVEAAGDIDVLLLDKTGTITFGNRMASMLYPTTGVDINYFASLAQISSLGDDTPEGRSIIALTMDKYNQKAMEIGNAFSKIIPFSAKTRMSGVDIFGDNGIMQVRKGAIEEVKEFVEALGGTMPKEMQDIAENIANKGATPLAVCEGKYVLGIIQLKDIVKAGILERFAELRKMGIRTVMITGDNPLTAAAIAAEAGVDDFMAQATPESKLQRIKDEQSKGHLVAMTGDGTNDAPALAQADVGVAMNTGTQAAREAGNMVDLDSNPTKLIEIVETGKQILMTRGALTTFSIANDVAKYFAIIPAMFAGLYATAGYNGPLAALNIIKLHSPQSAIASAVIFNALIIVALIPLALKGVKYQALGASSLLARNLLIYGLGGLISPFIGIKLIDLALVYMGVLA